MVQVHEVTQKECMACTLLISYIRTVLVTQYTLKRVTNYTYSQLYTVDTEYTQVAIQLVSYVANYARMLLRLKLAQLILVAKRRQLARITTIMPRCTLCDCLDIKQLTEPTFAMIRVAVQKDLTHKIFTIVGQVARNLRSF